MYSVKLQQNGVMKRKKVQNWLKEDVKKAIESRKYLQNVNRKIDRNIHLI